jgi:hypothetical protein
VEHKRKLKEEFGEYPIALVLFAFDILSPIYAVLVVNYFDLLAH